MSKDAGSDVGDGLPEADPTPLATSPGDAPVGDAPLGDAESSTRPRLRLEAHLAFLAILSFVLAIFVSPTQTDTAAPLGDLETQDGLSVPMVDEMTPVTLVHFWSTWCPPCIEETPAIQRLAKDLSANPEFSLLMVAVADDVAKVDKFLGSADATLYDPDWEVAKSYGTDKLPETHLVVGGELVRSFIGLTDWDSPEVRQQITAALEEVRAGG